MISYALFLLKASYGFLCSEIDIGTDTDRIGDVVSSGVVQPGWSSELTTQKYYETTPEIYFYVQGLEYIGPDFQPSEWHSDDENLEYSMKWIKMSVEEDEETAGYLEKLSVWKVRQDCMNKDGGATIYMNVTFTASTCDPITVNWYKVCGQPTITRDFFSVGFSHNSKELVMDGQATLAFDGNTKQDTFTVNLDDEFTNIYLYMDDPYAKTFFRPPYILTDHEVIYPVLQGTASTGGWLDKTPQQLQITWNCLKATGKQTELLLVIEMPYFHDIELHFFKRCGKATSSVKRGYWKKTSWKKILYYAIGGATGLIVLFALYKYRQGESGEEGFPFVSKIQDWFSSLRSQRQGYNGPAEEELPDFDDKPVSSKYGTL